MNSYILDLVGYQNLNRSSQYFDDPVNEIRAIDPEFNIIVNIKHPIGETIIDSIEVIPINTNQEEYIRKYLELRKDKIIAYKFQEENDKYAFFDYRVARLVGHIIFMALSAAKSKHPELKTITNGSFKFVSVDPNSEEAKELEKGEFINLK